MDTFVADTEAADDGIPGHAGSSMMQILVGCETSFVEGYPMKSQTTALIL